MPQEAGRQSQEEQSSVATWSEGCTCKRGRGLCSRTRCLLKGCLKEGESSRSRVDVSRRLSARARARREAGRVAAAGSPGQGREKLGYGAASQSRQLRPPHRQRLRPALRCCSMPSSLDHSVFLSPAHNQSCVHSLLWKPPQPPPCIARATLQASLLPALPSDQSLVTAVSAPGEGQPSRPPPLQLLAARDSAFRRGCC